MNKVFKVIWNEARNAYVVVSEIAKNHGSKSCSTKKLLAMLIATGVMTCASFDVLADEPSADQTVQSQYVAFAPTTSSFPDEYEQTIDGHKYIYDVANQYWVREGYILVLEQNAKLHTPLSTNGRAADVAYTGGGDTSSILQSVTSLVSASGTVTNMGESLNSINASAYAGVSHSGGTKVAGTWNYIIEDSSWKDSVAPGNYKYGYVDLVDSKLPKGFKTAEDPNTELTWNDTKQCYTYKGNPVDYSNIYVIDGKIGVFTNKDGSKVYTGNVFGKNNEVLMTVKDANNKFYSYWASEVTDPSATMQSYRMADYEKDLSVLLENEKKLYRNDIKEVTMTTDANSATIGLLRNGDTDAGAPVTGAITVTSGGGTEGSDTFVKISNGTANQTFATGSKVEVNGPADAITGIKVNGVDYTIKQGSGVKVEQDAANKTTTITVDGNATTITDTDTTYTAGDGIEINGGNAISVSKNLIGMESIQGAGEGKISFDGDNVKVNNTTFGENSVVVGVAGDGKHPVRIDGETGRITGLANTKVGYTDFANDKGTAATEGQLKQVMDEGWKFTTDSNEKTTVKVGPDGTNDNAVTFKGDGTNIAVTNTGKDIKVALKKDLTVDSVKAGDFFMDKNKGVGYVDKAYITSSGLNANNQKITGVADGTNDTDAVNFGQLDATNKKVDNLTTEVGKGWTVAADNGTATKVGAGDTVKFSGADNNIKVSNDGTNVKVELNKELTGLNSVTTKNAYVTEVNEGDKTSVTNVKFVEDKIAGVTLTAGDGISITDKKINVKLKEGEQNLVVDDKGLSMNTILKGMESIEGTGGIINLKGDNVTVNNAVFNKDGRIQNVANGMENTDAVNYGQLQKVSSVANAGWNVSTNGGTATNVKPGDIVDFAGEDNIVVSNTGKNVVVKLGKDLTGLNSVTTNNAYVTNVDASKGSSVTNVEYVKNQITDAALSAGNGISITDKKINVKLKDGEQNLVVDSNGLSLSTALTGIQSITGVGTGAGSISFADGAIKLNNKVTIDNTGKITGVAAGTADTDAVNVSQLNNVKAEAGKHTTLVAGENVTLDKKETDKGLEYTVNAVDTKYTAGNGITIDAAANNAISVNLKEGEVNLAVDEKGLSLNKGLKGIESVSNGSAKLALSSNPIFGATAELTNGQASVSLMGGSTKINGKVEVRQDGTIGGVTDGRSDKDAVNVSQLKKVSDTANAGWNVSTNGGTATNVKPGETVDFSGDKNISVSNDGTAVSVKLNKNLKDIETISNGGATLTLGAMGGMVSEFTNGQGASVKLFGDTTTINGKVNVYKDGRIAGVADGVNATDAVNVSQLQKAAVASATTVSDGVNTTVTATKAEDGHTDYKVNLNKDLVGIETISNGGATLTLGAMGGMVSEFTNGQGASVKLFGDTTTINGKVNVYKDGRIAGVADGVNATDAVNVSQLKKVSDTANAGWNLSTNGVTTEATNVKPGETVDFSGDKNISVSNDGTKVKVELNKNLKDIETISNGGASLTLGAMGGMVSEFTNGQGASVKLFGDTTTINGKVNVYKDGRIAGVADGVNATDAVNVSQLQKAAVASATTVSDGVNTTVTATKAEDGHTDYKVNLNKDLVGIETISNGGATLTLGAMGGMVSEFTNGQGASVKLFGDTTTINGKVNVYKDGRIAGVADGINNNDAVNVGQLNKVSEIANKGWNLATNGVATEATNVKPGETVDFSGDKNISVSHDGTKVKVELNKDIDVNSVQTNALNSKYNLSVGTMAENGIMPFFVNSTGAFYAASNKFSVDKDGNMNANSVQTNALNSKYNLSVGTANENGIVPFFVNSNGAFYAANNNFSVDKDGKVIATAGEIGNVVLNNGVYTGHSALRDGELFVGDASGNYSQITTKGAKLGKVTIAEDGKISGVAAGEVSSTSTDAINGSQLHQTNENVAALDKRVTQNEADIATNKANIAQNAADIAANKANIAQNAADIATNKANIAQNAADIAQNKADIAQNKADIAQNKADIAQNKTDIKNLDNRVTNVEELAKKHTTVTAGDNITVTEDTNKDGGKEYKVALDKDIKLDSVTTGQTVMNNDGLKVGKDVSVTATAVTAGKTSISDEGVKVGDKTYISADGLNANDQKVTNVAAGELSETSKDAVNGSQLYKTNQEVVNNTNRINKLGSRVNKVGAGAAALAALHPMDFDPDDKLTFSAGYGNYAGENAAAIGAYYRPDEKVMFSVAGTVGNGENMVNAGVSFALDRTNHVSNSRTALAREVIDLRGQLAVMGAKMAKMEKAFGMLDETKTKLFPDVPANHWAYEYIAKLAGNGYIEGYPDGNFGGDRLMTRYEFAAMLYRAIENGAALEEKIIKEFEPELGRIRVDRISGEDGDRDKIERVRVNDTKGERDHYGNKLAK